MSTNSFKLINGLIIELELCYRDLFLKSLHSFFHLTYCFFSCLLNQVVLFEEQFFVLQDLVLAAHEELSENGFELGLVFDFGENSLELLPFLAARDFQDPLDDLLFLLEDDPVVVLAADLDDLQVSLLEFELEAEECLWKVNLGLQAVRKRLDSECKLLDVGQI